MALGKKLRNRVIGALVIVALAMILIPAVMDPGQTYKKSSDAIAINGSGAVGDTGSSDYSDLLAPIEDNALTPEQVASQNSGKPLAVTAEPESSPSVSVNEGSLELPVPEPIPADPQAQVERLKQAQGAASANDTQSSGSEVLVSRRSQSESAKPAAAANAQKNSSGSETLVSRRQSSASSNQGTQASAASGTYTVQAGVFSQRTNADKVISKLRAAGISARAVSATINGKSMTRVYAGSAKTREAAEGIARRVQQVIGTKPSVVQL